MNCPFCKKPMIEVEMTANVWIGGWIGGKVWWYKYKRMYCDYHHQQTWQTAEQLEENLAAIKEVIEKAATNEKTFS